MPLGPNTAPVSTQLPVRSLPRGLAGVPVRPIVGPVLLAQVFLLARVTPNTALDALSMAPTAEEYALALAAPSP